MPTISLKNTFHNIRNLNGYNKISLLLLQKNSRARREKNNQITINFDDKKRKVIEEGKTLKENEKVGKWQQEWVWLKNWRISLHYIACKTDVFLIKNEKLNVIDWSTVKYYKEIFCETIDKLK